MICKSGIVLTNGECGVSQCVSQCVSALAVECRYLSLLIHNIFIACGCGLNSRKLAVHACYGVPHLADVSTSVAPSILFSVAIQCWTKSLRLNSFLSPCPT